MATSAPMAAGWPLLKQTFGNQMIKRVFLTIIAILLVVGALAGVKAMQIKTLIDAGKTMSMPPITVASAVAEKAEWENTISAIGTLEAAQGVMITAEAPGRVTGLLFKGGQFVKAGDTLVTQDITTEQSQLSQAESTLELARSNYGRVKQLFKDRVVSRADFDAATSQLNSAAAQLTGIATSIVKKQIVAPFDGRLGLSMIDLGQDLSVGVPIVSLQSADQMLVNFSLPQQALAEVGSGLSVRISTDALPGRELSGKITAINTQIDSATRGVTMQAAIDPSGDSAALLPGMYATVEVVLPKGESVLMVPATAVSFATFGDSVFIIESSDAANAGAQDAAAESDSADSKPLTVRQQFVQLGSRRGDFVAVVKGLEEGQAVVSEGVFKVRNGAAVVLEEEGKITPSLQPAPDNT